MPATPLDLATAISKAIEKASMLVAEFLSGAIVRKLNYRIEAAMSYVFVNEKAGEYAGVSDEKQAKLLIHFRKRVFDV